MRTSIITSALALTVAAHAHAQGMRTEGATDSSSARRTISAMRTAAPISIDGRFDEPAWISAVASDGFVQRSPREGEASTEPTAVRVLFDDQALYVAISAFDSHPDSIAAPLGRRDTFMPSDAVYVQIDSYRDRRTAFVFCVTPSGMKIDLMIVNGNDTDPSWDAVWDVATRTDSAGWYAEYRIPLGQLRFGGQDADGTLPMNVNFLRWISRRNEDAQWSLIPQTAAAWVPHYGELLGVKPVGSPKKIELQPYAIARAVREPGESENAIEGGADIRMAVTAMLTLTGALNPDFGQVEADPAEVNLTALETFFPERRPFFVEGSNLFSFSTGEWFEPGQLFYTRRIGRAPQGELPDEAHDSRTPVASRVIAAAKLGGRLGGAWSLGGLSALTGGVNATWLDSNDVGRRSLVEPRTAYTVTRLTRDFRGGESAIGALFTDTRRSLNGKPALALLRTSATVAAFDARHRFGGQQYEVGGWAVASDVRGSAQAITETQRLSSRYFQRPDADHVEVDSTATSLGGWAAGGRGGKVAGNWFPYFSVRAFSPGFEPNDLGYQQRSDMISQYASMGYNQPKRSKYAQSWFMFVNHWNRWNFAGDRLLRRTELATGAELNNWWRVFAVVGGVGRGLDAVALRGGPALAFVPSKTIRSELFTDSRRAISGGVRGGGWQNREGAGGRNVGLSLRLRPATQASLAFEPSVSTFTNTTQYVADGRIGADTLYVLGTLRQRTTSMTVRADYAFTPALTLQLYAEPFLSAGRYDSFRRVAAARSLSISDRAPELSPSELAYEASSAEWVVSRSGSTMRFGRPDFDERSLRGNAVLRWEYHRGSTLYLVWSQGRDASGEDGYLSMRDDSRQLFRAAPTNVFAVKASYWLNR